MKDDKSITQRYINTPFAYTKAQKGLTLLQQQIMVRVSAHLQTYVRQFFASAELMNSPERPKPIMTMEALETLPPIRIEMSELGIPSGTYSRAREALQKVLSVTIGVKTLNDDGQPTMRNIFLFSAFDVPVTDNGTTVRMKVGEDGDMTNIQVDRMRGYIDVHLNKDAVFAMFDMAQGYVAHPDDIARIGRTDNMPLMYYFVRHSMQNFKYGKSQVTPDQLREYLGMIKRDEDGNIVKVQYPKWSVFKSRIVQTALDDIKRVYDAGQIDFYFEMKEIRPRGKQRGEPSCLEFVKVGTSKQNEAKHRANAEKKLIQTLTAAYPTLDTARLHALMADVPQDVWDDFKTYAYNDLPKAIEQPHRWNGTPEEFVYYAIMQWQKNHCKTYNLQPSASNIQPGEAEWGTFLANYQGPLADVLHDMPFHSYDADNKFVAVRASRQSEMEFNKIAQSMTADQRRTFFTSMEQAYGQHVDFKFFG